MTREEAIKKLQRHKAEYLDEWVDFSGIAEALDMAIRALKNEQPEQNVGMCQQNVGKMSEKQTDGDLISRKAVINALCALCDIGGTLKENPWRDNPHIDAVIETIEQIPSAENTAEWIPVSERLPDYGVAVLTYDGSCYSVEKRIPTIRDDDGEPISGEWWVSDDYDESNSEYYPNLRDGACIAWMPLPEPYKVESEDKE